MTRHSRTWCFLATRRSWPGSLSKARRPRMRSLMTLSPTKDTTSSSWCSAARCWIDVHRGSSYREVTGSPVPPQCRYARHKPQGCRFRAGPRPRALQAVECDAAVRRGRCLSGRAAGRQAQP
ncbi:hypothetical protein VTI74DRAFT_571 [Chaetomium olivicolor]